VRNVIIDGSKRKRQEIIRCVMFMVVGRAVEARKRVIHFEEIFLYRKWLDQYGIQSVRASDTLECIDIEVTIHYRIKRLIPINQIDLQQTAVLSCNQRVHSQELSTGLFTSQPAQSFTV
jgi:hypothetical protein